MKLPPCKCTFRNVKTLCSLFPFTSPFSNRSKFGTNPLPGLTYLKPRERERERRIFYQWAYLWPLSGSACCPAPASRWVNTVWLCSVEPETNSLHAPEATDRMPTYCHVMPSLTDWGSTFLTSILGGFHLVALVPASQTGCRESQGWWSCKISSHHVVHSDLMEGTKVYGDLFVCG